MTDETTTTATETEATAIDAQIAELDAWLIEKPTWEPGREEKVREKIRLIETRPRPTPARPAAASAPDGPSASDELAARSRMAAYPNEVKKHPEGSRVAQLLADQYLRDSQIVVAAQARGRALGSVDLSFDVVNPPPVTPVVPPPAELGKLPQLDHGAEWPIQALEAAEPVFEAAGLGTAFLPALHLVRAAHSTARRWTPDAALAYWSDRYGKPRADELAADAARFDEEVLQRAAPLRAWLAAKGVLFEPELMKYVVGEWKRRAKPEGHDGISDFATALDARIGGA